MKNIKFLNYMLLPIMSAIGFLIVSLIFKFIIKDTSPIPVFIIFAIIQFISMTLFAFLPKKHKNKSRISSMIIIGSFILVLAGILGRNNFQIEGLFFYLFSGTMSGIIIHFMMGKIVGPLLFGRSWCAWGCWTAMILDLLPFKNNTFWEKSKIKNIKYFHFFSSIIIIGILIFIFDYNIIPTDAKLIDKGIGTFHSMIWFLTGNILYYIIGIYLAITLKDNRAFCKYICPISILFKTFNRITILRIKGDQKICNNCGDCTKKCPMSINIPKYIKTKTQINSTECILCMNCISNCEKGVLKTSICFNYSKDEFLNSNI